MSTLVQWCNQNQGFVSAVLTFIYVVSTIGLVLFARRSNALAQKNIETLTRLEEERLRPYVLLEIFFEMPWVCIKASNQGQTVAHDLSFEITPPLKVVLGGENSIPKDKTEKTIGFVQHGVKTLAPSQVISSLVGTLARVKEGCPALLFDARITYADARGKKYSDHCVLDLRYMSDAVYVSKKTVHDVAKELEGIKQQVNHIATGFSKPFVITQDAKDYQADLEALVRQAEERRAQETKPEPSV